MSTAINFLSRPEVQAWCDKQTKFRAMTAEEYASQLTDLIEYAGSELSEAEGNVVLGNAFDLIRTRLNIKIEAKFVMPKVGG